MGFPAEKNYDWTSMYFKGRPLFELKKFVFTK
jgi:hypothetical protein